MDDEDYKSLLDKYQKLEAENQLLRESLSKEITILPKSSNQFSTTDKLEIFKSLFKGREDIYAYYWESKDGKKGYAPARSKDKQTLYPLSDKILYRHLSGEQLIGVYPLLRGDKCYFLAIDFDKSTWQEECLAVLNTASRMDVPAYLERSKSGNGGHIWIFFEEKVSAKNARKLGNILINKSMEECPEIDFLAYDRMFPNQDRLPKGGFGNLIALPLFKKARVLGNSAFVDSHFNPYEDQWEFLAQVEKLRSETVDSLLKENVENQVVNLQPLTKTTKLIEKNKEDNRPLKLTIILRNMIYFKLQELDFQLTRELIKLSSFHNPEFYKAEALRLSINKIPRVISCYEKNEQYLAIPRGCLEDVMELIKNYSIAYDIVDERNSGKDLGVMFMGVLLPNQGIAASDLAPHDIGVLCAGTAFGKTVAAICLIASRNRNCLILVHRNQLIEQWRERLAQFLNISVDSIGQYGGGKKALNGNLDVVSIQSLNIKGEVNPLVESYGHIVVDECHHIAAFRMEQVLKKANAKYVLGLTATPQRRDGHHPIIFMQCGPIRYRISEKKSAEERKFQHVYFERQTGFDLEAKLKLHKVYEALENNFDRNELIIKEISKSLDEGRTPIVLTERKEHLRYLTERAKMFCENVISLHGGHSKKKLDEELRRLKEVPRSEHLVVLAIGSFIGEGFDYDRLDTLFLTFPLSWKGRLQQYAGRLHRDNICKAEVQIYDYVDNVPVLERMYQKRQKGYTALGYKQGIPFFENQEETDWEEGYLGLDF